MVTIGVGWIMKLVFLVINTKFYHCIHNLFSCLFDCFFCLVDGLVQLLQQFIKHCSSSIIYSVYISSMVIQIHLKNQINRNIWLNTNVKTILRKTQIRLTQQLQQQQPRSKQTLPWWQTQWSQLAIISNNFSIKSSNTIIGTYFVEIGDCCVVFVNAFD